MGQGDAKIRGPHSGEEVVVLDPYGLRFQGQVRGASIAVISVIGGDPITDPQADVVLRIGKIATGLDGS